jgi:four helix bundle protein
VGARAELTAKINAALNLWHKKLDVYVISLKLVKEVYTITKTFPKEEQFGLISQLRRAAISVCSNIAEGSARRSKQEKKRFYEIARSSAVEIDTQLEAALLLEYRKNDQTNELEQYLESAFRMLSKMIENLDNQPPTSH